RLEPRGPWLHEHRSRSTRLRSCVERRRASCDQTAEVRAVSPLLAKSESQNRQAPEPGDIRDAGGGREARTRGPILQTALASKSGTSLQKALACSVVRSREQRAKSEGRLRRAGARRVLATAWLGSVVHHAPLAAEPLSLHRAGAGRSIALVVVH